MAHYMFETEWALTAPVERVFDLLLHTEGFSSWWPQVKESKLLEEGDADGVGARTSYSIRSPLGYTMRFETKAIEVEPDRRIHNTVRGDLIGSGTYYLEPRGDRTHVRLNWYVSTTKPWMNLVAGFAKPLLAWSHHSVMRDGCAAMARALGAVLVHTNTRLLERPSPVPSTQ